PPRNVPIDVQRHCHELVLVHGNNQLATPAPRAQFGFPIGGRYDFKFRHLSTGRKHRYVQRQRLPSVQSRNRSSTSSRWSAVQSHRQSSSQKYLPIACSALSRYRTLPHCSHSTVAIGSRPARVAQAGIPTAIGSWIIYSPPSIQRITSAYVSSAAA